MAKDKPERKRIRIELTFEGNSVIGQRYENGVLTKTHIHPAARLSEFDENMEFCAALAHLEGFGEAEEATKGCDIV